MPPPSRLKDWMWKYRSGRAELQRVHLEYHTGATRVPTEVICLWKQHSGKHKGKLGGAGCTQNM